MRRYCRGLGAMAALSLMVPAALGGHTLPGPIPIAWSPTGAALPSLGSGAETVARAVGIGKRGYPVRPPVTGPARAAVSRAGQTPSAWCAAVTPGGGSVHEKQGSDQVATGSAGKADVAAPVALSAAHNLIREFGVDSAFNPADDSLAAALRPSDSLTQEDMGATLRRYAAALTDTCALKASEATLGPARVDKLGHVAVVHPGTGSGPVALPAGTDAGVIDLRGLPAVDGLDAALGQAVAPFLHAPVTGSAQFVRVNDGAKDEVLFPDSVYSTTVGLQPLNLWPATGPSELPLTIVTDGRLAPAAARFAGALRMARRAYLAGDDVQSAVAEMTWRGVGRGGLATRTSALDQLSAPVVTFVGNGQVIHQDDPNDPSTASYRRDFVASATTQRMDVVTHAANGIDIDLYLLEDLNGDGVFSFPDELVATSAGPTGNEHAVLSGVSLGGHYQILVHGFSVPSGSASFDITTTVRTGSLWPDVIPADFHDHISPTSHQPTDPPPVVGSATRSTPLAVDPMQRHPVVTGKGEMRASLIIVHGQTRRYYKYFDVEGDRIDARLLETLAAVDQWDGQDRWAAIDILRRFGQALHDGHQNVYNFGPRLSAGYLAVYLEQDAAGRPVVRRSAISTVFPGDTILSIDGRPIEQIYDDEYRFTSTATTGYRFVRASQYISRMRGPETLVLADPHGAKRTVRVDPQPSSVYSQVFAPGVTDRASGSLADLGGPDVAYLNLNGLPPDQVDAALTDANQRHAKALVVDMRGYPGTDLYTLGMRLIRRPFTSTPFAYNHFDGPDRASINASQYSFTPVPTPAWDGPIVLLTGPHAVSQAESFMQMLVAFNRPLAIVGQQSAGTTGDITAVQLPGGFGFSYTGMLVVNVDGSRFMGVGIKPDIRVPVTAADLANGTDRDLLTAIDLLHRRGL